MNCEARPWNSGVAAGGGGRNVPSFRTTFARCRRSSLKNGKTTKPPEAAVILGGTKLEYASPPIFTGAASTAVKLWSTRIVAKYGGGRLAGWTGMNQSTFIDRRY